MVMMKLSCEPGSEEATLSVSLTTSSPTISKTSIASSSNTVAIHLEVHVACTQSTRPDQPLTFCTSGTIFDTVRPETGHMDSLALGKLGPGLVCTEADGTRKAISLGNFRVHRASQDGDNATNLLERPDTAFVTVPSQASGAELVLTHNINAERLFAYAENIALEGLQVGERYEMKTNDNYLGTMWWCWGGLEGNLKGKKLHSFPEGFNLAGSERRPSEDAVKRDGWIAGEDVSKLVFRFKEGGNGCSVEVVE